MTKPVSAEKYIQTRARTLPLDRCLINADWETERLAFILVVRKHTNGNFTFAGYWVDLLSLGVRDTFYEFNVSPEDLKGYLDANSEDIDMIDVDYALAHNIIFAGHEFAGEYHIPQHPDFSKTTEYLLEEDSDDIPFIDVHTGDENGIPHLMVDPSNLQSAALAKLKQYAGEGNYRYTVVDDESESGEEEEEYDDLEEEDGEEEDDEFLYWNAEEWKTFIRHFAADNRHLYGPHISHIFLCTATWPQLKERGMDLTNMFAEAGKKVDWEYVYEEETWSHSQEEKEELTKIHYGLVDGVAAGKVSTQTMDDINNGIVRRPANPIFRHHLFTALQINGNDKAANEALQELVRLFPDYLVGKASLSEWLINNDRAAEVPALFNNKHYIAALYENRPRFHVNEFVHFSSSWLHYYLDAEDYALADFFGNLLESLPEGSLQGRQHYLLKLLMIKRGAWVIGLIEDAQKDPAKMEALAKELESCGDSYEELYPEFEE